MIRVDRQRRLTDSLKRAIATYPGWTLELADEPPFIRMRTDLARESSAKASPRVLKSSQARSREFTEIEPDELPFVMMKLLYGDLEGEGEARASSLLARSVQDVPDKLRLIPHFPWLIGVMAEAGILDYKMRDWVTVADGIEIEELRVVKK